MREEEANQKKLSAHESPSLISTTVEAKIEALRKPFNRLKDKKKPKPPAKPKPSSSTANETAADSSEDKAGPVERDLPLDEEGPWEEEIGREDQEGDA